MKVHKYLKEFTTLIIFYSPYLFLAPQCCLPGPEGQSVLLITIPSFHRDPTMVLVNLRTLECRPIRFKGLCDSATQPVGAEMQV